MRGWVQVLALWFARVEGRELLMKNVTLDLEHHTTLRLRSGLQYKEFPTRIRQIAPHKIEVTSPLEKGRLIPVPYGREVILKQQPLGHSPERYETMVLGQYWAENEREWVLVLSEPGY